MQYCGNSAQVPLGDGTWSKFMPIAEAEKYEHNLKVQRYLDMLRAGKQVIGLRGDIPAMCKARDLYKEARKSAEDTLPQATEAAYQTTTQRRKSSVPPL
jgi:hypothetical protein